MKSKIVTWLTLINLILTHFPSEPDVTLAEEVSHLILARRVVFAGVDLGERSCKIYPLFY